MLQVFRIIAIMILYDNAYLEKHINSNLNMQTNVTLPSIGYLAATVVAVFIALRGIIYVSVKTRLVGNWSFQI